MATIPATMRTFEIPATMRTFVVLAATRHNIGEPGAQYGEVSYGEAQYGEGAP